MWPYYHQSLSIALLVAVLHPGPASAQFNNLIDYTVPAPNCSISNDNNIVCDFVGILPVTGNLAYSIKGFADCTGTATRDSDMFLPITTASAVDGATSVTIDLHSFLLPDGASEVFEFCLLTSLRDDLGREMFYQGQKIQATFTADGGFTVSDIIYEAYDGISDTVVEDEITFTITAYRCDENRIANNTPVLDLGTTLQICIDCDDNRTVIWSIDSFEGFKRDETPTDLLSGNTELQGISTGEVTILTRPFASFFEDVDPLTLQGTVTFDIANQRVRRRLRLPRILQKGNETDTFKVQVDVEAHVEEVPEEESSAPALFLGSAIGFLAMSVASTLI